MFGKNKKIQQEKPLEPDVEIFTIPDVFYGGKDPEIYRQKVTEKSATKTTILMNKEPPKRIVQKSAVPAKSLFAYKWVWVTLIIFVVGGGAMISWYYIAQYQQAQKNLVRQQPAREVVKKTEVSTTTVSGVTTTQTTIIATTTPTSTISAIDVFLEFPLFLTLDTADIDTDNLTDIEEELFNTDSGNWDTDADGYYDGQEVFNLYNPQGFAPVKIIDSGLVREYINPIIGYRVYYPVTWQQGSVDVVEKQILFSSISGDYIELRIIDKDIQNQSFLSWFGRYAEGQKYTDVEAITNRFSFDGFVRRDDLVAYFQDTQYVVVMIYHPRDSGPIAYRHVMQMMYQSFRMQQTTIEIPDQDIFPGSTITPDETITSTLLLDNTAIEENITTTTTTTTTSSIDIGELDTLI